MKCLDCSKELGDKYVPYIRIVGNLSSIDGVCIECSEKYNSYKNHDGKVRDFCEKCGEKFLAEDLKEITIKKTKVLVCLRCLDE